MRYSNDIFHYMFKAEFVTLVSLKVPSGDDGFLIIIKKKEHTSLSLHPFPANIYSYESSFGLR